MSIHAPDSTPEPRGTAAETRTALEDLFTYHAPEGDQPERYKRIRARALELAMEMQASCPVGPDLAAAIRKVREAVMTANAAIATRNAAARLEPCMTAGGLRVGGASVHSDGGAR